jgi:hypothetical protein
MPIDFARTLELELAEAQRLMAAMIREVESVNGLCANDLLTESARAFLAR